MLSVSLSQVGVALRNFSGQVTQELHEQLSCQVFNCAMPAGLQLCFTFNTYNSSKKLRNKYVRRENCGAYWPVQKLPEKLS